jgi:hypothetical protein
MNVSGDEKGRSSIPMISYLEETIVENSGSVVELGYQGAAGVLHAANARVSEFSPNL